MMSRWPPLPTEEPSLQTVLQLSFSFTFHAFPVTWVEDFLAPSSLFLACVLLLLLSHFSNVQLCATPQTAAHQALPSLGFSRQKHWSGLPFPSPMRESEVTQLCPTLHNPMDYSLPGSSVHGIFQARVLEWGATAFSIACVGHALFSMMRHLIE